LRHIRPRPQESITATSVRTDSAKLTVYHALSTGELYDLRQDPGEFRNLWDDHNSRPLKEQMTATLLERMASTIDPLPVRHAPW
jgi:arylsulfatase